MADRSESAAERQKDRAVAAAAEENADELRKEYGQLTAKEEEENDEVAKPRATPKTDSSDQQTKKEAPEMNIQLQR